MAPIKAQEKNGAMPHQSNHENREGTARLGGSPGAFVFASAIGPRIMLAPPDEGGSGGGGGDAGAGGEGGAEKDAAAGAGGEGGGEQQPAVRPDYIPENFWDAEKGFKADDFNAILARDAERSAQLAQVPPSPDKYEAKLPHDFKMPEGVELKEGESLIDANDPRIPTLREFAHTNQFSQAQFEGMIALGAQLDIAEQGRLTEALALQVEQLGAKGKDRIGAVKTWVAAKLPADQSEAILGVLYTAKQIEAMESLMRMNRGTVPGSPGAARDAGKTELSDEEYDKMSTSERINYARQNSKK